MALHYKARFNTTLSDFSTGIILRVARQQTFSEGKAMLQA